MPLIRLISGTSTSASKIGWSPVEGLKKMWSTPAALSCATKSAPPLPSMSRLADGAPGDGPHPERAQPRNQLPARQPLVEILLDQFLHAILPRRFRCVGDSRRLRA